VVNIFGDDLDVLDAKAKEVAAVLSSVPGGKDVQVKSPPGAPRIAVKLRTDRLLLFGFRPVEVLESIRTAFQGAVVAQSYSGNRVSDIAVILAEEFRRDPESIGTLELRSAQGMRVNLSQLADIFATSGRHSIMHEGARRRQTVTCNPAGVDVATFVANAEREVSHNVSFPGGVYAQFSGAAQAREQAQKQLLLHSAIAAVGIFILLCVVFGNWRNLLLVLANVPFALVGGVLFVYGLQLIEGEGALSIGALVGFVTLFGITMRNSIMMISHFEHLVAVEGMTWGPEAAMRGATERVTPVLMTALVTALGLLPLAIGAGEAGREIEGPMAIVILGGLITSTLLNLLVLPALALRFGKFERSASDELKHA
jgi:Cu/Ag efflux pump CusA